MTRLNAQSSAFMGFTMPVIEPYDNAEIAQWAVATVQRGDGTEKTFYGACKESLLARGYLMPIERVPECTREFEDHRGKAR